MKNVILIGMPGCGKSTVGVLLAKMIGYGYIDSDLVIQTEEKKLLREIIAERGTEAFNALENKVNAGLWADRCVIATGGSVVYGAEAMAHLKEIGVVVYLKLSYREISRRLGDIVERGVSIKDGETLRQLYDERIVLYEKYADVIVDCEGQTVEQSVRAVYAEVKDL